MAQFDCIVLGAGIAGVTAARDLRQKGRKVLVLEGAHRVGGRMCTIRDFVKNPAFTSSQFPIEAGAEYIHVTLEKRRKFVRRWVGPRRRHRLVRRGPIILGKYKEFWNEIKQHGFTGRRLPKYGTLPQPGRNRVSFPDWKEPKNLIATMTTDCPDIWKVVWLFDAIRAFKPGSDPEPAGAFVDHQGYDGKGKPMALYTVSAHTPGVLDAEEDTISILGIKADGIPDQLEDPAEYRMEGPGGQIVGYDSLPHKIVKEFASASLSGPRGEIRVNHTVTRVERQPDGTVVVRATDDRGRVHSFTSRAAVCTFSVGMLKPNTGQGKKIFGPLLTPEKEMALETIRMGPITKFSLEFKECVWGDSAMTVLSNPRGGARTFFSAFPDRKQGPFVMTGLLMGKDHKAVAKFKEGRKAAEYLFREVEKMFNPDFNKPGKRWKMEDKLVGRRQGGVFVPNFHRQDWSKDPFALGGNSFISVNPNSPIAVNQVREVLKDPRKTFPVFWAGEATAPAYHRDYHPLAVHGAYISGIEVAKDVHHFLKAGMTPAKFGTYYREKYKDVTKIPVKKKAAELVSFKLTEEETRRLKIYARAHTGCDPE